MVKEKRRAMVRSRYRGWCRCRYRCWYSGRRCCYRRKHSHQVQDRDEIEIEIELNFKFDFKFKIESKSLGVPCGSARQQLTPQVLKYLSACESSPNARARRLGVRYSFSGIDQSLRRTVPTGDARMEAAQYVCTVALADVTDLVGVQL